MDDVRHFLVHQPLERSGGDGITVTVQHLERRVSSAHAEPTHALAREEQGVMEARIRHLQELLHTAKVGETPTESGTAVPGTVLKVRFEGDDDTETFLLGSREEGSHGDLEVYSPNSPLGSALIGAKAGDTVSYALPDGGSMEVTLVSAEPYSP